MHRQQQYPVINNWYTNLTGKLFKVRMASYDGADVGNLVIEYIDGSKQIISKQEWDCLKLMNHSKNKQQKSQKKQQSEELVTS